MADTLPAGRVGVVRKNKRINADMDALPSKKEQRKMMKAMQTQQRKMMRNMQRQMQKQGMKHGMSPRAIQNQQRRLQRMQQQFMQMQKTKMDQMQMRRERQMRKLQRDKTLEKVAPWLEDGGPASQAESVYGYGDRYSSMSPEQQRQVRGAGTRITAMSQGKGQVVSAVAPRPPANDAQHNRSPRMNRTVPAKSQRERRYEKIINNGYGQYGQPLSKRSTARKRKAARFVDDAADLLSRQMLPE